MSTLPRAYLENLCADCGDPLLESEKALSCHCIRCGCAMHRECGMRDARENDICEPCFSTKSEPLGLDSETAIEDAVGELNRVLKSLVKFLEKGATRSELHAAGERVRKAGALVTQAASLVTTELEEIPRDAESDAEARNTGMVKPSPTLDKLS